MLRFVSLITMAMIFTSLAFAGSEGGNGGGGIVCRDSSGQVTSVEILDFYEARTLRGLNIDLGSEGLGVEEKIRLALSRLAFVSPIRAQRYSLEALALASDAKLASGGASNDQLKLSVFLSGVDLTFTEDTAHIAVPSGCKVEQIINQRDQEFPEDRRFTFNRDIWEKMDSLNQAGLILHEVIYHEALSKFSYIQKTSVNSRYFLSYIAADKLKGMSDKELYAYYQRIKFPIADIHGNEVLTGFYDTDVKGFFYPCSGNFYSDGKLYWALFAQGAQALFQNQSVNLAYGLNWLTPGDNSENLAINNYCSGVAQVPSESDQHMRVFLWPNGSPKYLSSFEEKTLSFAGEQYHCKPQDKFTPWGVRLDSNGRISQMGHCQKI
jgi:hypothetical protein